MLINQVAKNDIKFFEFKITSTLLLIIGLFKQLTQKIGMPLLVLSIVANWIIMNNNKSDNHDKLKTVFSILIIFSNLVLSKNKNIP